MSDRSSSSSSSPQQQQQRQNLVGETEIPSEYTINFYSNRAPRRVDHTYHDYAYYRVDLLQPSDPDYATFHGHGGNRKKTNNFPAKLHSILSNPQYVHIIRWMPHGRAWKIFQKDLLVSEVIPKYWGQTKFESFMRQLSGWGFKRLHQSGPDFRAYYHECFLRGLPDLTKLMKRVESTKEGKLLPDPGGEPNFYNIQSTHPLPDVAGHPLPPPHPSMTMGLPPQYPPPPQPQPMIRGHGEALSAYYQQPASISLGNTYNNKCEHEYINQYPPYPPSHGYQHGTGSHGSLESGLYSYYSQIPQTPPYQDYYSYHYGKHTYGYQHPPPPHSYFHPFQAHLIRHHGETTPVAVAAAAAPMAESSMSGMQNSPLPQSCRHHYPTEPRQYHPPTTSVHHQNYSNPLTLEPHNATSPYPNFDYGDAPPPPQHHHNYDQYQYQHMNPPHSIPEPDTFVQGNPYTNSYSDEMNMTTDQHVSCGTPPPPQPEPLLASVGLLPPALDLNSTPPYRNTIEDQLAIDLDLDEDISKAFDDPDH